ncbi:hypothetical protein ACHAXT_007787 [Thalassiosira profunda]
MSRYSEISHGWSSRCTVAVVATIVLLQIGLPAADAFAPHPLRVPKPPISTVTALSAINKRNKFNKQKDLAAKMEAAKRQREQAEGGGSVEASQQTIEKEAEAKELTAEEIKLRNDRQRFADMLDSSISSGGDLDKGYYLTEEQENENADAVFRGVVRLYEGDPAPTSPFAELLSIENGEPIGKGGMKRLVPWEGSKSATTSDYLVVVTDPRPKSSELRTAMKRLSGALSSDVLKKCLVINTDSPAENRRFLKKTFGDEQGLRILIDDDFGVDA